MMPIMTTATLTLDQRTRAAAVGALTRRPRAGAWLSFVGPAVVASVAYVDPGNFATNIQAGAGYGYDLLWVVLWANLAAMLIQTLSAKIGIATGASLPELIRRHYPRRLVWFYWLQAEAVAIFTDLAEFLGAALGFHLLAGFSLPVSAVLSFVAVMALLGLEKRGFRPLEIVVGALVALIALSYGAELLLSDPQWAGIARGLLVPQLGGDDAAYLAAGILGATVMPHVIYLHSSLMQRRVQVTDALKPRLMRFHTGEIVVAMGLAGLVNAAMLAAAAAAFQGSGASGDLTQAWQMLSPLFGPAAAALFAVALLASGISSSMVGTMSGQVVMQGFVNFTVPLWLRRTLTSLPALALILSGADPSRVLVFSQVVLSFGIPFALVPLVHFTSRHDLMGGLVNRRATTAVGWSITALVIVLNAYLLCAGA